jgi:hypothetical protein
MTTATDAEFACECGRTFTSKAGRTIHQKTCADRPEEVSPDNNGHEKPKTSTPLNTTDRNQLQKLITRRSETMLKALEQELNGNVDVIKDDLLRKAGITINAAQLEELIKSVQAQIDAEVEDHTRTENERIEIETAELEEEYDEKEREMKERHKREWRELGDQKKDQRRKLKEKAKSAKERVTKEHAGHLVTKKQELQKNVAIAKQVEAEVEATSQQRLLLIKQSKGRLEHTIRDATNRALEELWLVGSREEATGLIEKIPTVSEALAMCQSPEGIHDLFRRLDPNVQALPAPTIEEDRIIDVGAEEQTDEDEDDEEEDDDDRDWDHDNEVYEEPSHRRRRRF